MGKGWYISYTHTVQLNRVKRNRNLTRVEVALGVTGSPVVELELMGKKQLPVPKGVIGQKFKY